MCKQNENFGFIARKLYQHHIMHTSDLESLTKSITCDTTNKSACDSENCGNNCYPVTSHYTGIDVISSVPWVTVEREHRIEPGVTSKVTLKKESECSQEVGAHFKTLLQKFKRQ